MTRIYRKEEVEAIKPTKESVENDFLKMENVNAVGIGPKIVNGEYTDELAIQVYVTEKKDQKNLKKSEIIPKTIENIKTDIIERTFVLQHLPVLLDDIAIMKDTGKYNTLIGGISMGPCRSVYLEPPEVKTAGYYVFVGTLGAVVKDNETGNKMLLSNFHVMCIDDQWKVGDKMAQPSLVDGGKCPADVVGELQRAALTTDVDAAVSSHTARPISCEIQEIGKVKGTANAAVGLAVRKRGRTTELTYGNVDSLNMKVQIDYGNGLGVKTLTNQIHIAQDKSKNALFGNEGDSGSAVVNSKNEIIGLHFAGGIDKKGNPVGDGIANPIQKVLTALNVSLCTQPMVKPICKNWPRDIKICGSIADDIGICRIYRDTIPPCKSFMTPPCKDTIWKIPPEPWYEQPNITKPGPIIRFSDMGYSMEEIVAHLEEQIMEIEAELEEMRTLLQNLLSEDTSTQAAGSGMCMSVRDMIKPCTFRDITCTSSSMTPCTPSRMIPCKPSKMMPCKPSNMLPCNPSKMLPVCEISHWPQCDLPLPDKPSPDPWWWRMTDEEKADYLEALAEEKETELEEILNLAESMRSGESASTQAGGSGICTHTKDLSKPCLKDFSCISSSMIPCRPSNMVPCTPYRMMNCKASNMLPCIHSKMTGDWHLPCNDIECRDIDWHQFDPRIPSNPIDQIPVEEWLNMGYSVDDVANYLEEVAKQREADLEDTRDMINELRGQGNSHFRRITRR